MSAVTRGRTAEVGLIAILVLVSAVNPLAVNIVVPAMPSMRTDLAADFAAVQLVLSTYLIATAAAQLVLGPLSDRFGRRPVLLIGLAVYIAASVACFVAQSIDQLIIARFVQGAGGCAGIALARAIVRDRYDREQSASILGYVTMGFAVAPMVGPLIGGLIDDHFGWRAIFAFLVVVGVLVTAIAWIALPETRPETGVTGRSASAFSSFVALSRIPAFWAYALTSGFATAVFFSFLAGTPFIASGTLGMSSTAIGVYFIFVAGCFMIGNYVTARYTRRVGLVWMIVAGSVLLPVSVSAMAVAFAAGWIAPISLFAPVYVVGFANGLVLPNAIAGSVSVRPDLAGAASGLGGAMQIGFGAVATLVVGVILGVANSALSLALAMVVFAVAAVVCAIWIRTARS